MPFRQDGASADSTTFAQIGYAVPTARLIVEPDKLLTLKRGIEDELERVRKWLRGKGDHLRTLPAPGADPCSERTAEVLRQNGQSAIDAATGYLEQLGEVAANLGAIASSYGLMEDKNAGKYQGSR